MRALQALVIVMGGLIVAGVIVIAITIVGRLSPAARAPVAVTLDEPSGTHIAAASVSGRQAALVLQGGGPDRVAIIDLQTGRRTGSLLLAR